jgi:hypothetical protein
VGGLTWERRPIDPVAGPRRVSEIEAGWELAPGVLLAGPHTRVRDREVHFAESRMAACLGRPTVLIDIHGGPAAVADGLGRAITALDRDLTVFIDVGGDVLAQGDEPGLRSPLCDAWRSRSSSSRLKDSAQAVQAFRGASGTVSIRGGARQFELSSLAAQTTFLDVSTTFASAGRLGRALAGAGSLEEGNDALNALGVRTELDLERRPPEPPR